MLLDLRQALRRLGRSPLYSLAAVATLGLGIAAATASFAVVDAVVVAPLPFRDPGRLVWVWATRTDRDRAFFSIPDFRDFAARNRTLDGLAALAPWGVNLEGAAAERLAGVRISPAGLALLGLPALREHAVVLGDALWRRRFHADPDLAGRTIVLDGDSYTVAGVLPARFVLPNVDTEVVAPLDLDVDPRAAERGTNFLRALARLGPGVTAAQARADLAGIARALAAEHPDTDAKLGAPRPVPLDDELVGGWRRGLVALAGAVLLVLAVACANFAGLALAQVAARADELAIRAALGATRARLARLLFLESALLAVAAAALGTLAAPWLLELLRAAAPADLPRVAAATVDGRALGFAAAAATACALMTGTAPALHAGRAVAGPRVVGGRGRDLLVVVQLAASLALLAGAGGLARTAARLAGRDVGFEPDGAIALRFSLPRARYASVDAVRGFHRALAARVAELPDVAAVATASLLPLSGANARTDFLVVGRPPVTSAEMPGAQRRFVGAGYFAALRVPLRAGRPFAATDDAGGRRVAIVDEALVRRFLGGLEPVGAHLVIDDGVAPADVEIVGVAADVAHFGLDDPPTPTLYFPIEQLPAPSAGALAASASLVVRARAGATPALAPALRAAVAALDPGVAASPARPLSDAIAGALAARRLALALVGVFGAVALVLAAVGLAALVAASVAQRTREIGVRLALGATADGVVRAVVLRAARRVGVGVGLGAVAVLPLAGDVVSLAAAAAVLVAVALVAAWIPARRAATIDPATALRHA